MAGYFDNKPQYTLLDNPQFQSAYSGQGKQDISLKDQGQDPMFSPDVARAAAYGAQSGGLSGALTSGGVTSLLTNGAAAGGPYAIAGGLILSQIEASQKAKAAAEQERIANEKNRMNATKQAYMNNANLKFGI